MARRCMGCDSDAQRLYLHHGRLICALCWRDDPTEPVMVRSLMVRRQARAVRERARLVRGQGIMEESEGSE